MSWLAFQLPRKENTLIFSTCSSVEDPGEKGMMS